VAVGLGDKQAILDQYADILRLSAMLPCEWSFARPESPDNVSSASAVAPDLCTARTTMR
jgi:hypothetical protein